jgi:hypothetical protein
VNDWERRVRALKDTHKENPWSPYAPQSKRGFDILARNENLACVLCQSLVEVKSEIEDGRIALNTDGSLTVACDHEVSGGYVRVSLIPDPSVKGGATVTATSDRGCGRGLIRGR